MTHIRLARVVIEIDGTAEINPADDSETVFVRERRDFDRTAIGSFVFPGHGVGRRHRRALIIKIVACAVLVRRHTLAFVNEVACARLRFGGMIVVGEAVEALAENFPDEQAAARLHLTDVTGRIGVTPRIVTDGLVAKLRAFIERQPVVGAGKLFFLGTIHASASMLHSRQCDYI